MKRKRRRELWVTNPTYQRPDPEAWKAISRDADLLKANAEKTMRAYDALPKVARRAVNDLGLMGVAAHAQACGLKGSQIASAIKAAFKQKLADTAVKLDKA